MLVVLGCGYFGWVLVPGMKSTQYQEQPNSEVSSGANSEEGERTEAAKVSEEARNAQCIPNIASFPSGRHQCFEPWHEV